MMIEGEPVLPTPAGLRSRIRFARSARERETGFGVGAGRGVGLDGAVYADGAAAVKNATATASGQETGLGILMIPSQQ